MTFYQNKSLNPAKQWIFVEKTPGIPNYAGVFSMGKFNLYPSVDYISGNKLNEFVWFMYS